MIKIKKKADVLKTHAYYAKQLRKMLSIIYRTWIMHYRIKQFNTNAIGINSLRSLLIIIKTNAIIEQKKVVTFQIDCQSFDTIGRHFGIGLKQAKAWPQTIFYYIGCKPITFKERFLGLF